MDCCRSLENQVFIIPAAENMGDWVLLQELPSSKENQLTQSCTFFSMDSLHAITAFCMVYKGLVLHLKERQPLKSISAQISPQDGLRNVIWLHYSWSHPSTHSYFLYSLTGLDPESTPKESPYMSSGSESFSQGRQSKTPSNLRGKSLQHSPRTVSSKSMYTCAMYLKYWPAVGRLDGSVS